MQLKNIELSHEHYRTLLKLVSLGRHLLIIDDDKNKIPPDVVEQLLFSFYMDFESEDLVSYNTDSDGYYPSEKFLNLVDLNLKIYEDSFFHQELIQRLSEKDLYNDYEEKEINSWTEDKYERILDKYIEKYDDEIVTNDLDNFKLVNNSS